MDSRLVVAAAAGRATPLPHARHVGAGLRDGLAAPSPRLGHVLPIRADSYAPLARGLGARHAVAALHHRRSVLLPPSGPGPPADPPAPISGSCGRIRAARAGGPVARPERFSWAAGWGRRL